MPPDSTNLVFGCESSAPYSKLPVWRVRRGCSTASARQYLEFMSLLDDLPSWLRISSILDHQGGEEAGVSQASSFWVQRCTIMVTFHCLRLIALQQCIDSGLCEVAGFDNQTTAIVSERLR